MRLGSFRASQYFSMFFFFIGKSPLFRRCRLSPLRRSPRSWWTLPGGMLPRHMSRQGTGKGWSPSLHRTPLPSLTILLLNSGNWCLLSAMGSSNKKLTHIAAPMHFCLGREGSLEGEKGAWFPGFIQLVAFLLRLARGRQTSARQCGGCYDMNTYLLGTGLLSHGHSPL